MARRKHFTRFLSSGSPQLLKRKPKHPISLTRLRPWVLSEVTAPPIEGRQQRSTFPIYKKRESPKEWKIGCQPSIMYINKSAIIVGRGGRGGGLDVLHFGIEPYVLLHGPYLPAPNFAVLIKVTK